VELEPRETRDKPCHLYIIEGFVVNDSIEKTKKQPTVVMIHEILDPIRAVINSQMNGRNESRAWEFRSIVIKDKV
jgi:hypothetical protein